MELMDEIIEPVFYVRVSNEAGKLYVPICIDDGYVLTVIDVTMPHLYSEVSDKVLRSLLFRVLAGHFVAEITPKLSLFAGKITTPDVWRPAIVKCSQCRVEKIQEWIEELNGKSKK